MPLAADHRRAIEESYAMLRAEPGNYADLFYHRLLQTHPFARALFPDELTRQAAVFRETLDALVAQIETPDALHETLGDLARRHVAYGVAARHYAPVGVVLIESFAESLGSRFSPAMRRAWEALYAETAEAMIRAAYPRERAAF